MFIKRITLLCITLFAVLGCYAQEKYTEEEIAFFKSLNGKWNPSPDYSSKWGTWMYDITLRYINGSVKVSYPATILIADKERSPFESGMATATYDPTSQYLKISYTTHILDTDEEEPKYRNMYYEVSLAIPLQTDIEDALVIYRYDTYPTGLRKTNEVMYYKH